MMLVALLGSAWHFWTCQCSNIQRRFWRLWCRTFGHPSPRRMGYVYKFDARNTKFCRRCDGVVS